ncbi:hypothetical protein [Marinicellulosiphila megalodicopiae]|uniref:hypothetical protein n=1 Tax=Marinicellulosiphila megalodicopiae TaxID=2724896 RepID=UPI003BB103BE
MSNILNFKGVFSGEMDLDEAKMVCVPSKPHYGTVDICLKNDGVTGNFCVLDVDCNSLSFEEKQKLGYEVEKRWNAGQKNKQYETNDDRLKELQEIMRNAEKLAHEFFVNCDLGVEREQARQRFENIRNAMRVCNG